MAVVCSQEPSETGQLFSLSTESGERALPGDKEAERRSAAGRNGWGEEEPVGSGNSPEGLRLLVHTVAFVRG